LAEKSEKDSISNLSTKVPIQEMALDEKLDAETFRIVIELSRMDGFDTEKIGRLTGLTEEVAESGRLRPSGAAS